MACGGCGRGGGKTKSVSVAIKSQSAVNGKGGTVLLKVEYTGPATQYRRIKAARKGYYKFGGQPGEDGRFFFVYPEDVHKFEGNTQFKVHGVPESTSPVVEDVKPLVANTPAPPAIEVVSSSRPENYGTPEFYANELQMVGLSPETASILVSNKFYSPSDLINVPDGEFLSIKGIGKARLQEIKDVVERLVGPAS